MIPRLNAKGKANKDFYTFKDLDGHTLIKRPGELDGGSFFIKDLKNCKVFILDHTAQITVDRCDNCQFFIGPIKSTIFVRNCNDCEFSISSS